MSDKELATTSPGANLQRYNWTGLNPGQMKGIAQAMALSGMFPDILKDSSKAFVKIMAGQEMGIPPFQAMTDISIIQGKAALGGNGHAAKVKASPKYDYKVKAWTAKGCSIEFFEIVDGKRESLGISQFDENDAQRAGLLGKGNWKTYPRNMYFNRAMTGGVRTFCPDALNGIAAYTPEELGANVDEAGDFVSMDQPQLPAATTTQPVAAAEPEPETEPEPEDDLSTEAEPEDSPDQEDQDFPAEEDMGSIGMAEEPEIPAPRWEVPEYKRGTSSLIRPEMRKYCKQLQAELGLNTAKKIADFNKKAIDEKEPTTFDSMLLLIEVMVDEANTKADDEINT